MSSVCGTELLSPSQSDRTAKTLERRPGMNASKAALRAGYVQYYSPVQCNRYVYAYIVAVGSS